MPTLDQLRQADQLALLASGAEFSVGSPAGSPLPLADLAALRGDEPWVVQRFGDGLTAEVYRLRLAGRDWTLKRARRPALVKNVDGQTSFLNELQRRADVMRLKAAGVAGLDAIVDTTCGSLRHGVLLSPWIDGEIVHGWDERRLTQVIAGLVACASAGLFEWDPSPGNLLDDGRRLWLFDFGYMYRFDPLTQFNSAGHGGDCPQFHPVERFETRCFFAVLLSIERQHGLAAALDLYRLEKVIATEACRRWRSELAARGASAPVLARLDGLLARWTAALAGDIGRLYLAEGWRSHALDLADDLSGQSCTPMTLLRADWLIDALRQQHGDLAASGALAADESGLGREHLLVHYAGLRTRAQRLQVGALS